MMTKKEFYEKYKFSDAMPLTPLKTLVTAYELADALDLFINEGFKGAAECDFSPLPHEKVLINLEYSGLFIKNLLSFVFGRTYLRFGFSSNREGISIEISGDEPLPLSYDETNILIRDARNAGFKVSLTERGFLLSLSFMDARAHFVYATDYLGGKRAIIGKLAEICFLKTE